MTTRFFKVFAFLTLAVALSSPALAKKKKDKEKKTDPIAEVNPNVNPQSTPQAVQARIASLTAEERMQYDALSDEQKKAIQAGRVEPGFNEFMIKLAVGEPLYGTEHHPVYTDYEQVWLYTKPEVKKDVRENQIMDPQTNWPTIHRTIRTESCNIQDFFILFDRGVVDKVVAATERKTEGSCRIETSEAYLPIVDGKPVEPR